MNAATLVTSLRIALSPAFYFLFTSAVREGRASPVALVAIWALFAIIEVTDFIDGRIARSTDSVTNLGKVFDPFADAFARLTYFFSFVIAGIMPGWVFLIVLYRDLGVNFIRLMAMGKGVAMGAQLSGKIKAWIYAIAGGGGLALISAQSLAQKGVDWAPSATDIFKVMTKWAWWAVIAVAAWTMIDYAVAYRRMAGKR